MLETSTWHASSASPLRVVEAVVGAGEDVVEGELLLRLQMWPIASGSGRSLGSTPYIGMMSRVVAPQLLLLRYVFTKSGSFLYLAKYEDLFLVASVRDICSGQDGSIGS